VRKLSNKRIMVWVLAGIVLVLFVATVAGLIYYEKMIKELGASEEVVAEKYPRLYAYIANDPESKLSASIYKEISEYAKNNGCYVEMTGQNLSTSYSKTDRINIAISSKVDGIILEGDRSEETLALIDKAEENGIPVVTVLSDCVDVNSYQKPSRKCFIDLNNYRLGSEYGNLLAKIESERKVESPLKVLILHDIDEGNTEDIIHRSISESAKGRNIELTEQGVNVSTPFSTQESILNILDALEDVPDVIVCLNDRTSESAVQCIVEKNLVGKTRILAYYDSETVLKGIVKGSVYATFAPEKGKVAEKCVSSLNEYIDRGIVSEYASSNYILIDAGNVDGYLGGGDEDET